MDKNSVKNSLIEVILDEHSIHSNKEYLDLVKKYQLLIMKYNNVIKTSSNVFTKMQTQLENLKRQSIYTRLPTQECRPTYECRRCDSTVISKGAQNHKDARLLQMDAISDD
ncbi:hypothetical protein BmR1_04g05490 [Babesia microti strain RI]|uniref:Uncharacterized protein n=1 Tax=Babesia microti (strain RI) TaxID=1133968 RepID=I7IS40_BABMR|nr:hypothetical protein BmR1_04g05490 [Babesia microti strain RI]CCF75296.1 hypothetical protein BmR1_04g05490 [Babesia microti strain RI]|eukprot:XP_012649704.1 hypothetical protein BmR1_04g05490 [Babesia microti strain RI]